ncbi:MAG: type II toxin-antitoxin system RelE/ParE family toxin [Lamprocystis purpurea]|jgi:plasmid stabilization system protein ParE|uniref:type II toxin-antitoxin system RelE/ParE family toxin n=1 Tax=Lamprocystis purpurea TaxID=61598 RepID=UPI00035D4AE4|nr:type II toxin-antitoxin system RelE/ParE family toxin [Lamprocystis purpurea]MBV5272738.1 type II toxin-antitoxin system RelE/ParE family toxin [Lamprocystis purpurea]
MRLTWTSKALSDLTRLHEFLALVNKPAAARTVQKLTAAASGLTPNPRIGEKLEEFEPRDVRRMIVGHYEIRYEIRDGTIAVLRLWHTREDR